MVDQDACAPCVKIILDCQGAIQSALVAMQESQRAIVTAFQELHDNGALTKEEEKTLVAFSGKVCGWAKEVDVWRWEGLDLYRKIAESKIR